MRTPFFVLAALALFVSACDSDDVFEDDTLVYQATLTSLNDSGVSGTATFTISDEGDLEFTDDDTFQASITASGLDDVLHPQHIHADAQCPSASADANDDGYVDVTEGVPSYGAILVPLDGQLTSAASQANTFPQGTSISYNQEVDYDDFLAAYQVEDDDASDAVATLGPNGALALDGRTVVLHGTSEDLPSSVASLPGLDNTTTLPVACGELELVALTN